MFGLGMPEILLILAIALIVIGPKKLPDLAKTLGRAMGEFKRSAQDFKRSIDIETTVKDSVKDITSPPAEDLKEVIKDVNKKDDQTTDTDEPEAFRRTAKKETDSEKPEADNASETASDADSKPSSADSAGTANTADASFSSTEASSAGASSDNGASAKE